MNELYPNSYHGGRNCQGSKHLKPIQNLNSRIRDYFWWGKKNQRTKKKIVGEEREQMESIYKKECGIQNP